MSQSLEIGIAVVLILAILVLIFRIQALVSVMRGSYRKRAGLSNKVNAILFVVFALVGFGTFFWFSFGTEYHLPVSSSEHGIHTDFMFWLTMAILVIAFVITHIFMISFIYKYQFDENRKAYFYPENHKLEFVWTIIPAIVMVVLVYYGYRTWNDIFKMAPADRMEIEVMGQQFNWLVRYPGADGKLGSHSYKKISPDNQFGLILEDQTGWDDFAPREIHIPKGKPVLLRIRARDVLHSVYLPHFRVKMDAVPGMPTTFWFTPIQTTAEKREELGNPNFNFELACAELCGRGHFSMRYILVVDEPENYKKWVAEQKAWAEVNREYVVKTIKPEYKDKLPEIKVATPDAPTVAPADTTTPKATALNIK
ncbi:MAG: cytochrome c oxidase subunit II [Cytophagaceae bacterium]|nr:cytochrome c oxidase subunit II [Cytophagaceae bacterium]